MKLRVLFFLLLGLICNSSAIAGGPPARRTSLTLLWDWPLSDFTEDVSFNFLAKTNSADTQWIRAKSVAAFDCIGQSASLTTKEVTNVVYSEEGRATYSVEWVLFITDLSCDLPPLDSDNGFFVLSYSKGGIESDIF